MIKHDLIEQVGGIEKARAIVDGAPEGATHTDEVFGYVKFKWNVGGYAVFDEWCSNDSPVTMIFKTNWHENSTDMNIFKASSIDLETLRTAIAEHDTAWMEKRFGIKKWYPIPEHHMCIDKRLNDMTDDCTDIRNHISPWTVVWDLASGEDWSVNHG